MTTRLRVHFVVKLSEVLAEVWRIDASLSCIRSCYLGNLRKTHHKHNRRVIGYEGFNHFSVNYRQAKSQY